VNAKLDEIRALKAARRTDASALIHSARAVVALQAEVKALTAERDALKADIAGFEAGSEQTALIGVAMRSEVERLKAERVSLKTANRDLQDWYDAAIADAKRYKWLRTKHDSKDDVTLWHVRGKLGEPIFAGGLDSAIDAAMKGEQA